MTGYLNLINLLAEVPSVLLQRLTAVGRRRDPSDHAVLQTRQKQAPPRSPSLWERRLRIQSIRVRDLSPHLRRDIGIDF